MMQNMSYTTNPHLPRIRREAAQLVKKGWSTRKVARHFGFNQSTIVRWFRKSKQYGYHPIPTLSSKPKHHPKQLSDELVWKIFHKRLQTKRCAEVVYEELKNDGVNVSLSSVKRTLDRSGLLNKRSPYKRYHPHVDRPRAISPGDLVQMDTIHLMVSEKKRIYVFVLLDVYSRWVYAKSFEKISSKVSIDFLREAESKSNFNFNMIQTDHGPEFGKWFVERVSKDHRYTRIGKPNDNSHIERFNRTVQEECLDKTERNVESLNNSLQEYIPYYNTKRLHMGINFKTPIQMMQSY